MNCRHMIAASLIAVSTCGATAMAEEKDNKADPVIPAIEALRCTVPPVVDGVLTDACWQAPAMITNLNVFKQAGRTRPVQAWLARDDAWLYVAIAIAHPSPKHVKRTVHEHNGPIPADDSVEIFLDPGTSGVLYFQYMLNSLNAGAEKYVTRKADQACPGGLPWRSGATLNAQGWSAEVAIPLAFLAAYGDLSKCRLNLNVNLVIPKIDPSQARVGEDKEWLTWAPVQTGFHDPDRFAYLKGLESGVIRAPFFPQFSDLTVERYSLDGGNYAYSLAMNLAGAFAHPGTAMLEIEDRPSAGNPGVVTQAVQVAGLEKQAMRIKVPVQALSERTAEVRLKNPETGEIYQSAPLDARAMAVLRLMTCYLDRTYYTTEPEARAICEFSLPPEELERLKVVVRGAGKPLAEIAPANARMQVPIPLKDLPQNASELQVELCRENGDKMALQAVTLIKRRPKPGCEWKIDRVNRILLRDGKPFFGFGIVLDNFNEDSARDIAAAGLNHVCILDLMLKPERALEHRCLAEKYGLCLMDYLDGYMTSNAPISFKLGFQRGPMEAAAVKLPEAERNRLFEEFYPAKLQLVKQVIAGQMDSPNVMGYFTIDEPGCHPEVPDMPRRGRDLYKAANEADGYHPLFLNFSSDIPAGEEWTDWTDVLGTDPYWITGGKIHRGTPNFVSKITWMTDERACPGHQPTWIIPMASYWSGTYKRMISPQEQFCQTYLALIHGAKCITYFAYGTLIHQANYDALRDLAKQMDQLGPVMLTPDVPQRVTYAPVTWDPDKALYPPAQAALRAHPKGGYVLLCANSKYYPVDVTFRLTGIEMKAGKVREMFEPQREHPLKDGAFSDSLEPFGVRAYEIRGLPGEAIQAKTGQRSEVRDQNEKNTDKSTALVEIAVTATDHPEKVQAEEPETPRSGRVGKKNLAPNPSFEETSLPGLPDYYFVVLGYHGLPQARIGTKDARYACVTNQPWHGRHCIQLAGRKSNSPAQMRFYLAPKADQPAQFVLSIYARADREGAQAGLHSLGLKGWASKTVALSTNWQRIAISGTIPPGLSEYNTFVISASTDNSTVWFDAVQMEKGAEPTEFEP